jgi:predicted DNA-binding transcriptional regulator AlpA
MNKQAKSDGSQNTQKNNQGLLCHIPSVYCHPNERVDSQQDQNTASRSKADATAAGGLVRSGDNEHFPPGASREAGGKADGPAPRPVVRESRARREDRCGRHHTQADAKIEPGGAVSDRLLSLSQTAEVLSISGRTVWRLVADGQIPAPVRIGRVCRWCCSDISSYIEKLKMHRDGVSE